MISKIRDLLGLPSSSAGNASDQSAFDSKAYWSARYLGGGNSGSGSYGRLAEFKARILNEFVAEHGVGSVVEFGCGDGNQLSLARYPRYVGLDITPEAVEACRKRFRDDKTKQFFLYEPGADSKVDDVYRSEMAISLDVIFHIIEDVRYFKYLSDVFASGSRFVGIYSSNRDGVVAPHVRHRRFTTWVEQTCVNWRLRSYVANEYPFDAQLPNDTSFSDFYFYERVG